LALCSFEHRFLDVQPQLPRAGRFFCAEDPLERPRIQTQERRFFPGAPDLAVEILSPNNTRPEMDERLRDFFASGTQLAWIINPETESAEICHSLTQRKLLGSGAFLEGETFFPASAINRRSVQVMSSLGHVRGRILSGMHPLIPIPLLEQIGDWIAEAGKKVFSFEKRSRSEQLALRERVADFRRLGLWIDDPGELRAAGTRKSLRRSSISGRVC